MNWKAVRYEYSMNEATYTIVTSHCSCRYDLKDVVELYDLSKDVGETTDVSADHPDMVKQAVEYMDEAHIPGPHCGYLPPHPNSLS